ncbi:hypothetical protein CTAYLR_004885, partial [Chrysophaeum taylorii]
PVVRRDVGAARRSWWQSGFSGTLVSRWAIAPCYAPGPEFFVAFVACLRAGVLAVPNYPPDPAQVQRGLEKLDLVTTGCGAELGLTDRIVNKLRVTTSARHSWPGIGWHNTEGLGEGENDDDLNRALFFHRLEQSTSVLKQSPPDDIAFLHSHFGYQLCTKRAAGADTSDIDLGCVVILACSAGQRCVPSILREFAAYFAIHCELQDDDNRNLFVPNYGLAEHVVATCAEAEGIITSRQRPDLASCGSEFQIDFRVVDAETRCVAPEGTPGELWLSSGSVALGYWGKRDLSSETFHARLEPDDGTLYLRTGDESFIEDGRLFR